MAKVTVDGLGSTRDFLLSWLENTSLAAGGVSDPKTKGKPAINVFNNAPDGPALPAGGGTVVALTTYSPGLNGS